MITIENGMTTNRNSGKRNQRIKTNIVLKTA